MYGVRDAAIWAVQNLVAAQRDAAVVAFQNIPDCLNAVVRALADPASPIAAQAATTLHLMTSSPMLQNPEAIAALITALMSAFDRQAENADSLRDTVSYAFGQLVSNGALLFPSSFIFIM
jgi:HEAT repeat protein